jgi:hypothetical protein
MLWFDNDVRTPLNIKVERAAAYYRKKYGLTPDLCLVHPSMLAGQRPEAVEGRAGEVSLRANRAILPGHLWIGVEDKN